MKIHQPDFRLSTSTAAAASVIFALLLAQQLPASENAVLLEGFENNLDYVEVMGSRATLETYAKTTVDDPFVTQGTNALKMTIAGTEWWGQDLRINLSDEASALVRQA